MKIFWKVIVAVTAVDSVIIVVDGAKGVETQTPQTFRLENIINVHEQAKSKGIINSVSSCTLLAELGGYEMHIVPGEERNIKITTTEDLEIFKVLRQTVLRP